MSEKVNNLPRCEFQVLPLRMAGTSSPSANSRMIVPETGEVLSSSKANFREAFLRGNVPVLAFLEGVL